MRYKCGEFGYFSIANAGENTPLLRMRVRGVGVLFRADFADLADLPVGTPAGKDETTQRAI